MCLHYIIDAYNVLFRALNSSKNLEKDRYTLITRLNTFAKERNCSVTVVFDGTREAPLSARNHYDAIELVYTHEDTNADSYIIELIEYKQPKNAVIVTNDRSLTRHVQSLRVKTMRSDDFLHELYKPRRKKASPSPIQSQKQPMLSQSTKAKKCTSAEPSSLADIDAWEKIFIERFNSIKQKDV